MRNLHNNFCMKTLVAMLASLIFASVASADGAPRLRLWITDPIGADASQCVRSESSTDITRLLGIPPTLTELDVTSWDMADARWQLNPDRFPASNARQQLEDHCFALMLDGELISRGVVLSSYSARLIRFPTIVVTKRGQLLDLRLTSSFYGSSMKPIHVKALDAVLQSRIQAPPPINTPSQ